MSIPSRRSITMMSNTGRAHNLVGDAVRADGYFGRTDGIHTVQVIYSNFTGDFGIQGTLELNPTEDDWFFVNLNRFAVPQRPLVRFPRNPAEVTGETGDTGTEAYTFVGNFVYLRAVLDRKHIPEPAPLETATRLGHIDKVLLCL